MFLDGFGSFEYLVHVTILVSRPIAIRYVTSVLAVPKIPPMIGDVQKNNMQANDMHAVAGEYV